MVTSVALALGCNGLAFAQAEHRIAEQTKLAGNHGAGGPILLGVFQGEAAKHNVEYMRYGDNCRLKEIGIQPILIEGNLLTRGSSTTEQILAELRKCHVADLFTSSEGLRDEDMARAPAVGAALKRFVEEGGGLLLRPQGVRYESDQDDRFWNLVFEPLGLKYLGEGVYDKTREYKSSFMNRRYFYTCAIDRHPVTENVKCLYLPMTGFAPFPGVPLLQYSSDWQVIVRGEPGARSYKTGVGQNPHFLNVDVEGSVAGALPVVAVRTLGKGRIVCWPVTAVDGGMNYGNPLWPHVVEERGDPTSNRPSQGLLLAKNAYRWLAEPAKGIAELGTYKIEPYKPATFPATVDWSTRRFGGPRRGIKGIVGARTAYSGGKGSVADYARAARQAGLSFIVFTDPLENLSKDGFQKLKADCAVASQAGDFFACPGYEFADGTGNRWACWSEKLIYPPESVSINYSTTPTCRTTRT
jgi:hypothetical protein